MPDREAQTLRVRLALPITPGVTASRDDPGTLPFGGLSLLDHLPEAVCLMDPGGRMRYANAPGEAILGGLRTRTAGRALADVDMGAINAAGSPLPAAELPAEVTRRTGRGFDDVELGFADRSGAIRWLRTSTRALARAGDCHWVVCTFADVTDARRERDELEATRERYRTVMESLHEGVVVQDRDGRVVASNPAAERVLGLSADELHGRTSVDPRWNAVHADGRPWPGEEHPAMRALRTGRQQVDQLMGIGTPSGERRWLLVNATPLADSAGGAGGVVASFTDVTARVEDERELVRSEERYRLLADNATDVITRVDLEGCFTYVSPSVRAFGWSPDELVGRRTAEVICADDRDRVGATRAALLSGDADGVIVLEYRLAGADGGWRWIESRASATHDEQGRVDGIQTAARDITERRAQDEALRRSTEQFTTAFAHAPIGMALVGLDGAWLRVNPSLCALLDRPEATLLATTFQELTHPEDLDADLHLLQSVLDGRRAQYTLAKRYLRPDGGVIHALLSVSLVRDGQGRPLHFVSQIQDVSDRHALEERLRRLAEEDPLTGLYNRRRFEQELTRQLERSARHGERAAVALLDLDEFKAVNDRLGHHVGDRVLEAAGAALRERARISDVVARLGGDEFAAILVATTEDEAQTAARAFGREIARHAEAAGVPGVTVSIGVAAVEPGCRADELLIRADRAMYRAKASGRGEVALGAA